MLSPSSSLLHTHSSFRLEELFIIVGSANYCSQYLFFYFKKVLGRQTFGFSNFIIIYPLRVTIRVLICS